MRLQKFLAHAGVASRRAAEKIIADGRVTLNAEVVTDPARDVQPDDEVCVDGERLRGEEPHLVYAVHKPAGVVSTASDPQGRPTVVDLIPSGFRLYPVGRLDADSTGLILLTNDGELANRLTHPRYGVQKTYRVKVRSAPVRGAALDALREGVQLEDGKTRPAQVKRLAPDLIEITIREGKKRQVRRMCEAVGHRVKSLQRVQFGPLKLGGLAEGAHRRLRQAEVEQLRRAAR